MTKGSEGPGWSDLLEPAANGRGRAARTIREFAAQRFPWVTAEPGAVASLASLRAADATLLPPPRYALAPATHPNIATAAAYLAHWPAAEAECRVLLDRIEFCVDTTFAPGMGAMTPGSSSHSLDASFGVIALTVDHAIGAAQAIVHETAHHKLRALGIGTTGAEALIVNPADQLFPSPIAPQRPLPMAALFHEAYSFLAMVELDLRMFAPETDDTAREHILLLLARNVPKLAALCAVVDAHIATDEEGGALVTAFRAWAARALASGRAVLRVNGYGLHHVG